MVGVGLDGVTINFPFFEIDDFVSVHWKYIDMCLGYTTEYNMYVYHSLSPCIMSASSS